MSEQYDEQQVDQPIEADPAVEPAVDQLADQPAEVADVVEADVVEADEADPVIPDVVEEDPVLTDPVTGHTVTVTAEQSVDITEEIATSDEPSDAVPGEPGAATLDETPDESTDVVFEAAEASAEPTEDAEVRGRGSRCRRPAGGVPRRPSREGG